MKPLRILNIGIDRSLLDCSQNNEAHIRQLLYATELPAHIVHLVKSSSSPYVVPFVLGSGKVKIISCPSPYWICYPFTAISLGSKLLQENEFDLIQVQEPFLCGAAGYYLSKRFRLPLVVNVLNDEIDNLVWLRENPFHPIANRIGKLVLRHAAAIRADSRAVANRLLSSGFNKVSFIPFLITNAERISTQYDEKNSIRHNLLNGKKGPLVLAVARLERQKNISMLIDAFGRLFQELPEAILAIVGDGRLKTELHEQAARLAQENIRWCGWVSTDQLPLFYQAADLLVLSSNTESSARVLTEALLAATPVLSTDTAGAREVIEDGKSGRIVPVGDTEIFAKTLLEMCQDSSVLKEMGLHGQRQMMDIVSKDSVINGLRNLFLSAIGGKK